MIEVLFGTTATELITSLGSLTVIVTIIVEVLKKVLPNYIPTQILTFCISLIICLLIVIFFGKITITNIICGLLNGFFVAYISMFGFDTFKSLWTRFKNGDGE